MHITWHGNYAVSLQSGSASILLDPYSAETGLTPIRGKFSVVGLTNPADPTMSYIEKVAEETFLIDRPGEYSLGDGISLKAIGWHTDNHEERVLHRWTIEGMTLLHVGALFRALTPDELQELEKTALDIVLLPVGGGSGLTTSDALSLLTTLEPRIVIPIHYQVPGVKEKLTDVTQFAKEMGVDASQREKKFLVKQKTLPTEGMLTVLLTP